MAISNDLGINKYQQKAATAAGQVQQAQGPNLGQDQQWRQGQVGLAGQLAAQAAGGGPNPAGLQMQAGMAQNASNAMALAGSGHGINPGLSGYYASQGIGAANQQAANQAAQLRAQQQIQAQQSLAGLQAQGRSADQGAAGMQMQGNQFNAGQYNQQLGQDTSAQNQMYGQANGYLAQHDLAEQASNNELRNNAVQQGVGGALNGAGKLAAMSDERVKTDIKSGGAGVGSFLDHINDQSGAGGGIDALAISDERQKSAIKPGGAGVGSFLDRLKAHEYRYKRPDMPGAGGGQHVSVMAQELEKAGPVGQGMVKDTTNGKAVDYGHGFATMLAAQADLHQRVKGLEAAKGMK